MRILSNLFDRRTFTLFVKYISIFIKIDFIYRVDFALRWFGYPARLLIAYLLWRYLATVNEDISANLNEIIVYYVFALFLSQLFSFIRLSRNIREEIYGGDIVIYAVRAVPHWLTHYARMIASVGVNALFASPAIVLIAFVLTGVSPTFVGFVWFVVFFLIGITITFQIYYILGLTTFFIEEIVGTLQLYQMIGNFMGGVYLPLQFFPPMLTTISVYLPFRYWVYLPARAMSTPPTFIEGASMTIIGVIWVVVLQAVIAWEWKKGWMHYSGHSI